MASLAAAPQFTFCPHPAAGTACLKPWFRDRENGLNRTAGADRREHLAVQIVHRAVDNRRDDEQDSRAASLRMSDLRVNFAY